MEKLEIIYEIKGIDRILYNQNPSWKNCEFSMEKENIAQLRIWEEGISNTSQIELAKNRIENRFKSFILALEFRLMLPLTCTPKSIIYPTITTDDGATHNIETISFNDEVPNSVLPVKPPDEMPSLPLECEPWVLTLAEAHIFGQYVEEQFKRQYLIIEELWDEFANEFDSTTKEVRKILKLIRNFVSHPTCHDKKIIKLVSNDLPTSVLNDGKVKFFRNDIDHRNYIATYEVKSRAIARILVEKKILKKEKVS